MSDNPYQSPAETQLADFSAENAADAGPRRLGVLIWTILILDCVPCLLRMCALYFYLEENVGDYQLDDLAQLYLNVGIAAFSLSGNVLVLLKLRAGFPLVIMGMMLSIISWSISIWMTIYGIPPSMIAEFAFLAVLAVMALWEGGWLLLYGFVVWKAAKKLGWIRWNANPEERAQ